MKRRPAATRQPPDQPSLTPAADRRAFLALCSGWGLATTLFPGVLWAGLRRATTKVVTRDLIDAAAAVAGVEVADEHKDAMLAALNEQVENIEEVRALNLNNDQPPALVFDPVLQPHPVSRQTVPAVRTRAAGALRAPADIEALAFAPVTHLARLLSGRKISSTALTEMYLERLMRLDPQLHAVVTLTSDRARTQAREADRELAAGKYRGPLHGIPWGAKDLLSVKGYPTTWGAEWLREQRFESDATVVQRLDAAGAVLVAKLSLGTLAMNADQWFGGMTRNPWNLAQGSKGSSAGPASAVAAGCVGFAIGSETLDSISAPCARCGATGLRPTFGRVPRTGAMALCWSLDKLGPIGRTVEDCALILAAINGGDMTDRASREVPFGWDARRSVRALRVGYLKSEFEGDGRGIGPNQESAPERLERQRIDAEALEALRRLGVSLAPVDLPAVPWRALLTIPKAEAAATFDELIRRGNRLLDADRTNTWTQTFRVARFLPAVDYINANRTRVAGMQGMARLFEAFDVIVAPTSSVQLIVTNLTGHPALVLPNGFRADGTPTSLTFLGDLFGEPKMLTLAHAYQQSTDWHTRHPTL